jgi:hypothetical protein
LLIKLEEYEKNREGAALSLGRCPVAALARVLKVNPQPHTCAALNLGCLVPSPLLIGKRKVKKKRLLPPWLSGATEPPTVGPHQGGGWARMQGLSREVGEVEEEDDDD